MDFYLKTYSTTFRGGYYAYNQQYIEKLPIRTINLNKPEEAVLRDHMVTLVERMLQLNKDIAAAKTPDAKQRIQRQIDATDTQIDNLVYKLYNLTDEEINIIKNSIQ